MSSFASASTATKTEATSSHIMKTTTSGRPFQKATLDLFGILVVSLRLSSHRQTFRTFPNSFTLDEAAQNLSSVRFSQCNRETDPRDSSRVATTTRTFTFSMTRDMAKAILQHFMDARLIENAADPPSYVLKDRGIYILTPKGLHVLERFISKNGVDCNFLPRLLEAQPICSRLVHLERRPVDDEVIFTHAVIKALFRRFVGRQPNYVPQASKSSNTFQRHHERSKGIILRDITDPGKTRLQHKLCFTAIAALEWLCDFTSVVGRDEAAEIAAHFVQFHLITLVNEDQRDDEDALIFTVRGPTPTENPSYSEFICSTKAIYKITDEGSRLARWGDSNSLDTRDSHDDSSATLSTDHTDDKTENNSTSPVERKNTKESNPNRLRFILENPTLQSLFREFLRESFCEENLSFWLDVQNFRRKFGVTSSVIAATPDSQPVNNSSQAIMERHHEFLINMGVTIYHTYLSPTSRCELSIEHRLRNEVVKFLEEVSPSLLDNTSQGYVKPEKGQPLSTTQLQRMVRLYEHIQTSVFGHMAMDSVPKFSKSPKFLATRSGMDDEESESEFPSLSAASATPTDLGIDEESGGSYITTSQLAGERDNRLQAEQSPSQRSSSS